MTTEIATDLLGKRVRVMERRSDNSSTWRPIAEGLVRAVSHCEERRRGLFVWVQVAGDFEFIPTSTKSAPFVEALPAGSLVPFRLSPGDYFDGLTHAIVPLDDESTTKPDDAAKAAERLVFALAIYGGHKIDSRGPLGCIMDALRAIAPGIAGDVAEVGATAALNKHWPEE